MNLGSSDSSHCRVTSPMCYYTVIHFIITKLVTITNTHSHCFLLSIIISSTLSLSLPIHFAQHCYHKLQPLSLSTLSVAFSSSSSSSSLSIRLPSDDHSPLGPSSSPGCCCCFTCWQIWIIIPWPLQDHCSPLFHYSSIYICVNPVASSLWSHCTTTTTAALWPNDQGGLEVVWPGHHLVMPHPAQSSPGSTHFTYTVL